MLHKRSMCKHILTFVADQFYVFGFLCVFLCYVFCCILNHLNVVIIFLITVFPRIRTSVMGIISYLDFLIWVFRLFQIGRYLWWHRKRCRRQNLCIGWRSSIGRGSIRRIVSSIVQSCFHRTTTCYFECLFCCIKIKVHT